MKITLKNLFLAIYVLVLLLITISANAQTTLTQTIKCTVIDKDSEMPLIEANIIITSPTGSRKCRLPLLQFRC